MGTPPPYTNVNLPLNHDLDPTTGEGVARVLTVNGDHATVDIGGSTWTVKVPGSVLGVKVGKSVHYTTHGNNRVVTAMVEPLPTETYNTDGTPTRGYSNPVPGYVTGGAFGAGGLWNIQGQPYAGANPENHNPPPDCSAANCNNAGNIAAEINAGRHSLRLIINDLGDLLAAMGINATYLDRTGDNFDDLVTAIDNLATAVNGTSSPINDIRDSLAEVRDVTDTLIGDLRTNGLVE